MMVISYVKQTASRKSEQSNANCDGKTKTLYQIQVVSKSFS